MLNKLKKSIRRNLLKINWFKRKVEAYRIEIEKKKQRHKLRLDLIMNSGRIRNLEPEKLEPFDTLAIVTDDGVLEEYQNGKVVGRESLFIDSENWG